MHDSQLVFDGEIILYERKKIDMEQLQEKSEKLNLYWMDTQSGKLTPAGVGFFNPEFGEYRLKVDLLPEEKSIYLRPTTASEDRVNYRLEVAVKRNGKISHRALAGCGYSNANTNGNVFMDLGPYSKSLVLELNKGE